MVTVPHKPSSTRWLQSQAVRVGGEPKSVLLARLEASGVRLNSAASLLFSDDRFTASEHGATVRVVFASVRSLGLPHGATFARIVERAHAEGLALCPLELGPHLRLQLTDQPEGSVGQPSSHHRAPPGSITVASLPLDHSYETPRGFYLRRIDGELWLRGYRSSELHTWSPLDILAFLRPGSVA